eukprot:g4017.t1
MDPTSVIYTIISVGKAIKAHADVAKCNQQQAAILAEDVQVISSLLQQCILEKPALNDDPKIQTLSKHIDNLLKLFKEVETFLKDFQDQSWFVKIMKTKGYSLFKGNEEKFQEFNQKLRNLMKKFNEGLSMIGATASLEALQKYKSQSRKSEERLEDAALADKAHMDKLMKKMNAIEGNTEEILEGIKKLLQQDHQEYEIAKLKLDLEKSKLDHVRQMEKDKADRKEKDRQYEYERRKSQEAKEMRKQGRSNFICSECGKETTLYKKKVWKKFIETKTFFGTKQEPITEYIVGYACFLPVFGWCILCSDWHTGKLFDEVMVCKYCHQAQRTFKDASVVPRDMGMHREL